MSGFVFRTKIMIKRPQTVFEIENRFQETKHALATTIQSAWRGHAAREWYKQLKTSVIRCQRLFRHRLQCRKLRRMREYAIVTQKIVFVQKNIRRMLAVRAYKKKLSAARTINKYVFHRINKTHS